MEMKKVKILTALLLVVTTMYAQRQEYMYIEKSDGTKEKLLVSDIQQMYFSIEGNPIFGKEAEVLDLGLSVKWACWDLGATKKGEIGGYYCWADPSGTMTSTDDKNYPSAIPPLCISGTEYDIARVQWGMKWRMPTRYEVEELVNSCSWSFTTSNGRKVARGTAPNKLTIDFPLAGEKWGKSDVVDDEDTDGYFYSGSCFKSDNIYYAIALWCSNDSNKIFFDYGWKRMYRFNVRPVQGEDVNVITSDAYAKPDGRLVLYGTVAAAIGLSSYTRGFFISRQGTPSASNYVKKCEDSQKSTDGYYSTGGTGISDLDYQTNYSYCAYVCAGGKYYYGQTKNIKTKGVVETLSVIEPSISLESSSGSTGFFTINSNVGWEITGVPEWLSVSQRTGNGNATVTVTTLSSNSSTTQPREAILTVSTSQKSAKITVTQAKKIEPTIIYREPYTAWGASRWQTKNYMNGYELYDEDDNSVTYYGKDLEALIMYSFQNSMLVMSTVAVPASSTTFNAIDQQLKMNNYSVFDDSEEFPLYLAADNKTIVAVDKDVETNAFYIRYMDINSLVDDILFDEPYTIWNASRSTVKETMKNRGYELYTESNKASEFYVLAYYGKKKETLSFYFFNSYSQLDEVDIVFDASKISISKISDYLKNQLSYTYIRTNTNPTEYYYLSKDGKSHVRVAMNGTETVKVTYINSQSSNGSRQITRGFTDTSNYSDCIGHIKNEFNNSDLMLLQLKVIIEAVKEKKHLWPIPVIK